MTDAQQHINDLTRRQTIRIEFLPGRTYTATAPSPLAQLRAAASSSTSGHGGGTVPGSRLPVNADALDLWALIVYNVHSWATHLGVNRTGYHDPGLVDGLGDFALPPTGRLLRAVYAQAVAAGRAETADRIGNHAGVWHGKIQTMLSGTGPDDRAYPLRDYPCLACGATLVTAQRDGEAYREPAVQARVLVSDTETGLRWPYLVCLACGDNGWAPYHSNSYAADLARLTFGEAA